MGEREADLTMWQHDRMAAIRNVDSWPGFYFLPHGLDTPKQSLAARARGIVFYDRELRLTLCPFGRK